MTTYLESVERVRALLSTRHYAEALRLGRSMTESGCASSELLVLMAAAALLGEGVDSTHEEVRSWLEQAVRCAPHSVDAALELAHFLDAVEGDGAAALAMFDQALSRLVQQMQSLLDGYVSAGGDARHVHERVQSFLRKD